MSKITSLAVSVSICGFVAVWLFLTLGTILIWAAFVAWACFFAFGGDATAFITTIISNAFGVFVASTTAVVIISLPLGEVLGATVWPALVVAVSIALYILAANFPPFASIPGTTFGYASTFAYLLQTPDRFTSEALLSISFTSSYFVVFVSMAIGTCFALASAKGSEILVGKKNEAPG
ncbi:DUF1097 domain-containing protein [Maritimibacter sp. 55A14]|uniref:DUF1097 domain-containing protein n=1 Tax=Maritimibacter sp. 55A14 TaxID=2174844 RepID=UPI001304CE9B|nr:DUF1097 domain-containing protein [Maritimibacter sp. 55A14]